MKRLLANSPMNTKIMKLSTSSIGTQLPNNTPSILIKISEPSRRNKVALEYKDKVITKDSKQDSKQHDENTTKVLKSKTVTYGDIDDKSNIIAKKLSDFNISGLVVGGWTKSSDAFVLGMMATWKVNGRYVPLGYHQTKGEVQYIMEDSKMNVIICEGKDEINESIYEEMLSHCHVLELSNVEYNNSSTSKSAIALNTQRQEDALIVYTSGTTGRPKGVLHTHNGIEHIMKSLIEAWEYNENDKILHFLPLYHVHGLINKLLCMLFVGGNVEFLPSAAANVIWNRLIELNNDEGSSLDQKVSLFMAVPTVYAKMIEYSKTLDESKKQRGIETMKAMRLMVCGSAALPDPVMMDWKALTGHILLERYGMTEIGMALSNPYQQQTHSRLMGHVGLSLPFIQCRLVDVDTEKAIDSTGLPGELRIKGPQVFKEYLNNVEATKNSFDSEGWFKTGDIAEVNPTNGYYKILGRNSSDIIKSSGYKISALEIERELLSHPQILEAAVVGAADTMMGEKVIAIIKLRANAKLYSTSKIYLDGTNPIKTIKEFLKDSLVYYKHPKEVHVVEDIPRNHLGKVNKKRLLTDLNIP